MPEILLNLFKNNQDVKDFVERDAKLQKLGKNKYPLLKDLDHSDNNKEIAFYLNMKHREER